MAVYLKLVHYHILNKTLQQFKSVYPFPACLLLLSYTLLLCILHGIISLALNSQQFFHIDSFWCTCSSFHFLTSLRSLLKCHLLCESFPWPSYLKWHTPPPILSHSLSFLSFIHLFLYFFVISPYRRAQTFFCLVDCVEPINISRAYWLAHSKHCTCWAECINEWMLLPVTGMPVICWIPIHPYKATWVLPPLSRLSWLTKLV